MSDPTESFPTSYLPFSPLPAKVGLTGGSGRLLVNPMIYPKNWSEFQHYKDRNPPWIKLHRTLLDDPTFQRLPIASRALAPMLWLLASSEVDGQINLTSEDMAFRFRMIHAELLDALNPLIQAGLFVDASGMLAGCKQVARPETERETKTETKKKRPTKGIDEPIPVDFVPFLDEIVTRWPRKRTNDGSRVTVIRPVDCWEKIQANRGADDPKVLINAALAYLDTTPVTYTIGMDNFFGQKRKYTQFVLED